MCIRDSVEFMGVVSGRVQYGVPLQSSASSNGGSIEEALEDMGVLGAVTVTSDRPGVNNFTCTGENITVTLDTFRGDAPPFALSTTATGVQLPLYATETAKGVAQPVVGSATYSTVVTASVSDAEPMFFRVAACNHIGCGVAADAAPDDFIDFASRRGHVMPAIAAPQRPASASALVASATSVTVAWDAPLSDGKSDKLDAIERLSLIHISEPTRPY